MNILILEDTNTFVEEFVDILKNNNLFTDAHFFCLGGSLWKDWWYKKLPSYFYRCSFK